MSHIVEIKTQVRDAEALRHACGRLKLAAPQHGTFRLFSSQAEGLAVRLRDWKYPVVCQLDSGKLQYDNYGGRWGASERLGELLQAYGVEKTRIEARKQGHTVTERQLQDGSIKLSIQVGQGKGGAV